MAILRDAGLKTVDQYFVATEDDAVVEFKKIGKSAVMKLAAADILHKADCGGVALNLNDEAEVRNAFRNISANGKKHYPDAKIDGCTMAAMAGEGIETTLGVRRDPVFGPVVTFGLAGMHAEMLKDVSFRVAPFDVSEARRMIREIRSSAILDGVRGQPPGDKESLAQALSNLSIFAAQHGNQLASLDVSPFLVRAEGKGAVALDAAVVTSKA